MAKQNINNPEKRDSLVNNISQRLWVISTGKETLSHTIEKMEKEIDAIRDKYLEDLETLESSIVVNERILIADMKKLNLKYGLKKVKCNAGSVLIRAGRCCVKLLNSKVTESAAIALVRAFFGGKYIRTKEELNKEAIIKAYAGKLKLLSDKDLAECGLRVDRVESIRYKLNPPAASSAMYAEASTEGLSAVQNFPTPFTKGGHETYK